MTQQLSFQLLPPLSEEEYAALKSDIAARGVQVPIEYDEHGNVLDGHHRLRACRELGITPADSKIRYGLTEAQKVEHVLALNLARRHLTKEQRQELTIKLRQQGWSTTKIGETLRVDHSTVVRDLATCADAQVALPERVVGLDGKSHPAHRPVTVYAATPAQTAKALELLPTLPTAALPTARAASVKEVQRAAHDQVRERQRAAAVAAAAAGPEWSAHYGSMEQLLDPAAAAAWDVAWGQVDCILTDPPYGHDALPLYGLLGQVAARVLKPGGSCFVLTGQSYLPEVVAALGAWLTYHWTVAYLTPGGQAVQQWARKINTFWKPVLWYRHGEYAGDWVGDVTESAVNDNDKRFHEWGQSESGMADLVKRFTRPGELILDPLMGAGTTGVAAVRAGRRFIGIDQEQEHVETARQRLTAGGVDVA